MPPLPPLHELESRIMEVVWRRQEVTVRSVADELEAAETARSYSTVLTVMVRLDRKGLLCRRRYGKRDVYTPVVDRDTYRRDRSVADVEAVITAYGEFALAHFAKRLSDLESRDENASATVTPASRA